MKKRKSVPRASNTEPNLPFEIPPWREPEPLLPQLKRRIWTSHKAKLIERYLYYFVLITKHGSYIDGFAGPQYQDRPEMWSWEDLVKMSAQRCQEEMVERFRTELGYRSAKAWPIFERQSGGRIMYFMIHATDHAIAPELMYRAYHRAVTPKETTEQLKLELDAAGLFQKHQEGESRG